MLCKVAKYICKWCFPSLQRRLIIYVKHKKLVFFIVRNTNFHKKGAYLFSPFTFFLAYHVFRLITVVIHFQIIVWVHGIPFNKLRVESIRNPTESINN